MDSNAPQPDAPLQVRVLPSQAACTQAVLEEFQRVLRDGERPLISFSGGSTYHPFLDLLNEEVVAGRVDPASFLATHLDEYQGFPPDRPGSMLGELVRHCPPLAGKLRGGTFFPVPCSGDADELAAHKARLERAGGVVLQLLGLGRNGHIAHCEPGTPLDSSFQVQQLTESTRMDARERFHPNDPPQAVVTAGLSDIRAARRIVLVATGAKKAPAVDRMLRGDVGSDCPASVVRTHSNAVVILDQLASHLER